MIRGNGFILRTARESDLDALLDAVSNVEARGDYMNPSIFPQPGFRKEFQETGFWAESQGRMLIFDLEERLLGHISYFRPVFYSDALEIGYQLYDASYRRKGLMTDVLRLFCSFLFSSRSVYRLQVGIHIGNVASRRVAEKAGFRPEGILRGFIYHRGAHHDVEVLSLLRGEMEPVAPFTPIPDGRGV